MRIDAEDATSREPESHACAAAILRVLRPASVVLRSHSPLPHLLHRRQELGVALGLAHLVEEQFHRFDR